MVRQSIMAESTWWSKAAHLRDRQEGPRDKIDPSKAHPSDLLNGPHLLIPIHYELLNGSIH
jgi:hypothetical protein